MAHAPTGRCVDLSADTMTAIFAGRPDEQGEFCRWISAEPPDYAGRRAALLIGAAGSGKSALITRFEDICLEHVPDTWYVQRAELNANETPSAFLERLLDETHRLFLGTFLRTGPRDHRLWKALLKAVPKAGELLAALVGDEKRPGWLRFIDYVEAVSDALRGSNRLVFLVDPDRAMASGQADEWLTIAQKLPRATRLLIAQRPDDVIAADPEAQRRFYRMPGGRLLGDLDEESIRDWYKRETISGRLVETADRWGEQICDQLASSAWRRYGGYPVAHDAIVRLLAGKPERDAVEVIEHWPAEVTDLMNMLFDSLACQDPDRLRAAFVLQIFGRPVPKGAWSKASGLRLEELIGALSDARFRYFFTVDDSGAYAPFHALFAERLERELIDSSDLAEELSTSAWSVIEPALRPGDQTASVFRGFELLAATNVAARFRDSARLVRALDQIFGVKVSLGILDSAGDDMLLLLDRLGNHDADLTSVGRATRWESYWSSDDNGVPRIIVVLRRFRGRRFRRHKLTKAYDFFRGIGAKHMADDVKARLDRLKH
jgi:hypothetical protein